MQEQQAEKLHISLPQGVQEIISRLQAAGFEAFAVGGCVRDSILGRKPEDWDITTSARPEEIKRVFRRTVDTGIEHGTVTVMLRDTGFGVDEQEIAASGEMCEEQRQTAQSQADAGHRQKPKLIGYEVTTYRIDGAYLDGRHPESVSFTPLLAEDLRRRDFTINAMAYNDEAGLVDLFGGIKDLKARKLRCVGDAKERFHEDALRILRAVRFAGQLNFQIEERTKEAMRLQADNLLHVSKERILTELTKLLCASHSQKIALLFSLGLSKSICETFSVLSPEPFLSFFEETDSTAKKQAGTGDASTADPVKNPVTDQNTALTTDPAAALFRLLPQKEEASFWTWCAAFDVKRETDKQFRYIRFAYLLLGQSRKTAERLLRELKADNETIRKTGLLAAYLLRPIPSERYALKKVMQEMEPALFCDLLMAKLSAKDTALWKSTCAGEEPEQLLSLLREVLNSREPVYLKDLAVNGADLIAAGIPAGPALGARLAALLDEVQRCPVHNTREYLLKLCKTA